MTRSDMWLGADVLALVGDADRRRPGPVIRVVQPPRPLYCGEVEAWSLLEVITQGLSRVGSIPPRGLNPSPPVQPQPEASTPPGMSAFGS